jgi:hypothetical protein
MDNFSDFKHNFEAIGYHRYSTKNIMHRKKGTSGGKERKRRGRFVEFLIYGGAFIILGGGLGIFLIIYILIND